MSAAEHASKASSVEQANELEERVNEGMEGRVAQFSTVDFIIILPTVQWDEILCG